MVNRILTHSLLLGFICASGHNGCRGQKENNRPMEIKMMLEFVRNDLIQFATMRPPESKFVTLERRVLVTSPPELVNLSGIGDLHVLDELVKLLQKPDRAWAAVVILAAMTRREEKIVDDFATNPDEWWNSVGQTAFERWSVWLSGARGKLVWDSEDRVFVEKE